ncbi:MAG: ATP-binding protein [Candidatus Eremiobacterota bacterium]
MGYSVAIVLFQSAACLALLLFCATRPIAQPDLTPLALALAALGVGAELASIRLPGVGVFSVSPALYLAAAQVGGSPVGATASVLGVALRTALKGHPRAAWRVREGLSDLLGLLAFSGLSGISGPRWLVQGAALNVYLGLALWLPAGLSGAIEGESRILWRIARGQLALSVVSAGCLGVAGGFLVLHSPFDAVLCLVVVLAGLRVRADHLILGAEDVRRRVLEIDLRQARQAGQEAEDNLASAREDYRYLLELLNMTATNRTVWDAAERLVDVAAPRLGCSTLAVFLERGGHLEPAAVRSREAERLADPELLGLEEPLVRRVWETGRASRLTREQQACPDRLFPHDETALAYPLSDAGVLYVGYDQESSPRLTAPLADQLALVACQSGVALKSLGRKHDLEVTAAQLERTNRALERWLQSLAQLVEGNRMLTASLDSQSVLQEVVSQIGPLVPCDSLVVQLGEHTVTRPDGLTGWEEAARTVAETAVPLLVNTATETRFVPLVPGEESLLGVPVWWGQEVMGAILLGSVKPAAFRRRHQHVLSVLALQAGLAFRNARLHEDLRLSLEQLHESQLQLVHSSKMAAVGQLAAGVAHELNTPLASSLLNVQAAIRNLERDPSLAPDKLELAARELRRARTIVDKLLNFSRSARAGRRICSVRQLIQDTLELLGDQFWLEGASLEVDLPPAGLTVCCNPNEIQQVLINLLLNARDAVLAAGSGCIRVRCAEEPGWAGLVVEDTGVGIPADAQPRVFEPFFTTKPVGRGTGLGLSVSLQLVEAHGGSLTFSSREGEGTRFVLHLPLGVGAPQEEDPGAGGR